MIEGSVCVCVCACVCVRVCARARVCVCAYSGDVRLAMWWNQYSYQTLCFPFSLVQERPAFDLPHPFVSVFHPASVLVLSFCEVWMK